MSNKDYQNGFIAGAVSGGVVEVIDTTEIDNLETLIDESGVLENTEGTVTEKVEELLDKAEWEKVWYKQSEIWATAEGMFDGIQSKKIPKIHPINCVLFKTFCRRSTIEEIDYLIETNRNNIRCEYMFQGTTNLKYIVGIKSGGISRAEYMFSESAIEVIEEPFDFSDVTGIGFITGAFTNCNKLREIRLVTECLKISISFAYSPLLSAESIQSIIDGLATVSTAQTLTLHKNIVLTDEQKSTINAKGWTLAQ